MKKSGKNFVKVTRTFLNFIVKCEEGIIFATGIFVTLAIFIQVFLRYVVHAPLFGLEEISIIVISWFYFIGASYSVYTESSIKADLLSLIVKKPSIRKRFNIANLVLCIVATLLLFFYGLEYAIWLSRANIVTPTFLISKNFNFSSLLIGAILMSLHFIQLLQREIKCKKNQNEES